MKKKVKINIIKQNNKIKGSVRLQQNTFKGIQISSVEKEENEMKKKCRKRNNGKEGPEENQTKRKWKTAGCLLVAEIF